MADSKDLELGDEDPSSGSSSQSVRKNIAIKLNKSPSKSTRGRGKKGRPAKKAPKKIEQDEGEREPAEKNPDEVDDMDILEEVQFASMKMTGSGSQEPMHKERKLDWDHKVNLIGEKVVDPLIHCCGKCGLPILIYGRMIPCKHVFCFDCARQPKKNCPRSGCGEPVTRIEQSALGTVFICTFGGTKHGVNGCQRTYLSQRDLQAHISHRHLRNQSSSHSGSSHSERQLSISAQTQEYLRNTVSLSTSQTPSLPIQSSGMHEQAMSMFHQPPPIHSGQLQHPPPQTGPPPLTHIPPQGATHPLPQGPPSAALPPTMQPPPQTHLPPPSATSHVESYHTIPVMSSSRTNLITVPIQEENAYRRHDSGYSTQPPSNPSYPPPSGPPPSHFLPNTSHPPPQVSYSTGPPPFNSSGPPPHHGPPPMGGPPPMSSAPPPHGGPRGPPVSSHAPPPRYPHYEEYNTGSPRPHWQQSGPPRGPPPPRPPANNPNMGPPPPRPYNYQ